jgi:hypothetical protein
MQDAKGGDAMVVEAGGVEGVPSLPMSSVQPAAVNQTGVANKAQGTQEGEAAPGTRDGVEGLLMADILVEEISVGLFL